MAPNPYDFRAALAELRRQNQALQAECRHLHALFDRCPCGLLVTDPAGVVCRANGAAAGLLGTPASALAGRPLAGLLAPEDRGAAPAPAGAGPPRPVCLEGPGGARVCARPAPLPGAQDGPAAVLWQLGEARAGPPAELTLLAAGLSHEARNILQRGQAAVERLQWRLQDRPEALDLLARVQRAQDDQARLYETLREYTAPLTLSPAPHDLAEVWREAWARLTAEEPRRDARLTEAGAAAGLACEVDRGRLAQAFRHLLHSALAAAPDPVRVVVSCRETTQAGGPAVTVSVRDNGPPLDAEQRRQLFEPFAGPRVRRCGLGLAAARRIIEAHGGRVVAGEDAGPGVEVLVTLPRRKP
jgi:signal transduction histidine kinase